MMGFFLCFFFLQLTRKQTLPSLTKIKYVTLIIRKVMNDSSNANKLLFTVKTYLVSHLCSPLSVGFFIGDMAIDDYILKTPLSERKGTHQL